MNPSTQVHKRPVSPGSEIPGRDDLTSCLYRGWVHHRRHTPNEHSFRYPLFLLYLDLDELTRVFAGRWLWSVERRNVASFWRDDYLGPHDVPLAQAVRDRVERASGFRPTGPIRMLAHLRYLGFCFNPVTFYYCFDPDGETLRAVVAEVTNTPWNERHTYVLTADTDRPPLGGSFPKQFHVSPFFDMDHEYHCRFTTPADRLAVHMQNRVDGKRVFDATLRLERRPLRSSELARVLCRHPFMTGTVVAAIYWQAVRLWRKRMPFFPHPKYRSQGSRVESRNS